jgi:hypothetical protein
MRKHPELTEITGFRLLRQFRIRQNDVYLSFRHSGLDLWFDEPFDRLVVLSNVEGLTTLSQVEGESSAFPEYYDTGCRIKSGMTCRI